MMSQKQYKKQRHKASASDSGKGGTRDGSADEAERRVNLLDLAPTQSVGLAQIQ
jgi:hypothetical protein